MRPAQLSKAFETVPALENRNETPGAVSISQPKHDMRELDKISLNKAKATPRIPGLTVKTG